MAVGQVGFKDPRKVSQLLCISEPCIEFLHR